MFGLRALKSINIYIEDHVSQQHVCLHVSLPGFCLFLAEGLTVPHGWRCSTWVPRCFCWTLAISVWTRCLMPSLALLRKQGFRFTLSFRWSNSLTVMFDSPSGTPKQGFKVYSACSRPEHAPKGPWPDVESASSLCAWTTSAVALRIDLLPRQSTKQKRCVYREGQDALEFGCLWNLGFKCHLFQACSSALALAEARS